MASLEVLLRLVTNIGLELGRQFEYLAAVGLGDGGEELGIVFPAVLADDMLEDIDDHRFLGVEASLSDLPLDIRLDVVGEGNGQGHGGLDSGGRRCAAASSIRMRCPDWPHAGTVIEPRPGIDSRLFTVRIRWRIRIGPAFAGRTTSTKRGIPLSSASASNTPNANDLELAVSRTLDAPCDLVFKAYTDPEMVAQWWGLRASTTIVERMDVRPDGQWRFIQREADGTELAFFGEYREVTPPARLVNTFEFEPMPGHVIVDTATFEDVDGKTRLTVTSLFQSVEDRDGMLASGMEGGANESWDQLAELLASARQASAVAPRAGRGRPTEPVLSVSAAKR